MSITRTHVPNYAEIHLPVWKQGDDFHSARMNNGEDLGAALNESAMQYQEASLHMTKIKCFVEALPRDAAEKLNISGDTHMIWVNGPQETVDALVDAGLAVLVERDFEETAEDEEVCEECGGLMSEHEDEVQ